MSDIDETQVELKGAEPQNENPDISAVSENTLETQKGIEGGATDSKPATQENHNEVESTDKVAEVPGEILLVHHHKPFADSDQVSNAVAGDKTGSIKAPVTEEQTVEGDEGQNSTEAKTKTEDVPKEGEVEDGKTEEPVKGVSQEKPNSHDQINEDVEVTAPTAAKVDTSLNNKDSEADQSTEEGEGDNSQSAEDGDKIDGVVDQKESDDGSFATAESTEGEQEKEESDEEEKTQRRRRGGGRHSDSEVSEKEGGDKEEELEGEQRETEERETEEGNGEGYLSSLCKYNYVYNVYM